MVCLLCSAVDVLFRVLGPGTGGHSRGAYNAIPVVEMNKESERELI